MQLFSGSLCTCIKLISKYLCQNVHISSFHWKIILSILPPSVFPSFLDQMTLIACSSRNPNLLFTLLQPSMICIFYFQLFVQLICGIKGHDSCLHDSSSSMINANKVINASISIKALKLLSDRSAQPYSCNSPPGCASLMFCASAYMKLSRQHSVDALTNSLI